jgi:hypothetical protein
MIEDFTLGMSIEQFREDPKTVAAVERKFLVIGEAAVRLGRDSSGGRFAAFEGRCFEGPAVSSRQSELILTHVRCDLRTQRTTAWAQTFRDNRVVSEIARLQVQSRRAASVAHGMGKTSSQTNVVEAGGVEPPSEKARNEESTCVARFFYFGQRFRAGKTTLYLARLISDLGSGQKPASYPAE